MPLDHSRIQIALMLSTYGRDYEGGLFVCDKMQGGRRIDLCKEEGLQEGDLVLFRHANPHGVAPIESSEGSHGFVRILMPPQTIRLSGKSEETKSNGHEENPHPDEIEFLDGKTRYYRESSHKLMRIAIREGFEPSEVFFHRGLWVRFDGFQEWQMDALKRHGLLPSHQCLDIGCGFLKLGMKLIPYLEDDHYCGADPVQGYLHLGRVYMKEIARCDKQFQLTHTSTFDFSQFDRQFDFAISHSVFTHLSRIQVEQCVQRLKSVMRSGGKLLFTACLGQDHEENIVYTFNTPVTKIHHKDFSFFEDLGERLGLRVEFLGRDQHPTQFAGLITF